MRIVGHDFLTVKVKKTHPNAVIPKYARPGDAGLDLTAVSEQQLVNRLGPRVVYDTGLSFEIPEGYVGLVFPRSSVVTQTSLDMGNCVGVIDSSYRGSVKVIFRNVNQETGMAYNIGDRIAQLLILPYQEIHLEEVNELTTTERGIGGFGSTN